MKNATLSVLLILSLGAWASVAAAQADEPEGGEAPSEPSEGTDDSAATDEAATDEAATDEAATDEAATDEAATDEAATDEAPTDEAATVAEPASGLSEPSAEDDVFGGASTDEATDGEEATDDEAAEEEEEESAAPEPIPWRNTFFTYTNQATFNSFVRNGQLSYNPQWQMNLNFAPRWYLGPMTQLRGSIGMSLEVTDTDFNALNRDPQVNDALVTLMHMISWEGFIFMPNIRVGIPISKLSQAAQRYVQAGAGLTLVRIVPEVNLTLAGVFRYSRWFAGSNVVQVGEPQPDRCPRAPTQVPGGGISAPEIATVTCDQLGSTSAASDIILAGISATMTPFGGLSINLSAFLFTLQGFGLAPAYIDVGTSEEPVRIADGSPNHFRNFTYISLSVAYQFLPWLNMSLGIQNSGVVAPAYNPQGNVRNPIFTPDTQVFLSATFGVDTLWNELFGQEEEELTPEERQRRQQGLASGPSVGGAF